MKQIITLNDANQPYGFPQLDASGSLHVTGSFTGSFVGDGSGLTNLPIPIINTSSLATTGSNAFLGDQSITGSLETAGSQVYHKTNAFIVENVDINGSLIEATTAGGVYIWSTNTNPSADFENRQLIDENGNPSVVWSTQRTLEHDNGTVLDWANQTLNDYGTFESVDWNNRQLVKSDGTTVTLDWETGAFTGLLQISGSLLVSGSITSTAGAITKTNVVSNGTFSGTPLTATITFATAFPNTNYSVVVTGEDARSWTIESKTASGFTINSNSSVVLTGDTFWQASSYGEFNG